jgi:hypothetical protein
MYFNKNIVLYFLAQLQYWELMARSFFTVYLKCISAQNNVLEKVTYTKNL